MWYSTELRKYSLSQILQYFMRCIIYVIREKARKTAGIQADSMVTFHTVSFG